MAIDNRLSIKNRFSKISVSSFSPPLLDYLIGWYKHNEGGGSVVLNYGLGTQGGGKLPNLTVVNLTGKFWNDLVGFGSSPSLTTPSLDAYSYFNFGSSWGGYGGATGACHGGFFRLKAVTNLTRIFYNLYTSSSLYTGQYSFPNYGSGNYLTQEFHWQPNPLLKTWPPPSFVATQWIFSFYASDGYWHVVKPNGTKITSYYSGLYTNLDYIRYLYVGLYADGSYPLGGSYGDIIFYNKVKLSVAQWAIWYDYLRRRYGMSARSGW